MSGKYLKTALFAAIAPVGIAAASTASAQSIAYADPAVVIAQTQARTNGYSQIGQAYASNIQQMQQKSQQAQSVLQTMDKNGDKQVDDAEWSGASASTKQQLETLQTEINNLQQPIEIARLYVLEQISDQYEQAQASVVSKNKINVILKPSSFVYMPESGNVTEKLTAELDRRVSQVQTTPPQNWNPRRSSVNLYQQVSELLQLDAYLRALSQAQQQQQNGAAPTTPPASSGQTR